MREVARRRTTLFTFCEHPLCIQRCRPTFLPKFVIFASQSCSPEIPDHPLKRLATEDPLSYPHTADHFSFREKCIARGYMTQSPLRGERFHFSVVLQRPPGAGQQSCSGLLLGGAFTLCRAAHKPRFTVLFLSSQRAPHKAPGTGQTRRQWSRSGDHRHLGHLIELAWASWACSEVAMYALLLLANVMHAHLCGSVVRQHPAHDRGSGA